ncbi:MAG: hypothetical protein K2L23_00060 [Odoribacter sp.]|nr:hypothetical protein [Odoribacter sp.]
MGIDYLGHAYKMKDLSSGIFVNQNFTSEQYAMAIRKYQYLRLSKTQNRVNTKSTDIPTTSDTPLEACIQGCYFAYNRDLRDCENGGFGHEHERAEDLILCQMILQSKLTECIKRCQEMYTPSIPDSTTTTRPVEPGTTDPTKPDPTKPTGNN